MRVAAGVDDVWRTLLAHPSLRGALAGYTGTAVLEEVDDDERVARFRLQGVRGASPATATVTAALSPAGAGTEVALAAEVFGDVAAGALLAAVAGAAAPAMAAPVAPPAPAPAARGLSAPAKRALAAAGAAALVGLALRGRR